MKNLECNNSNLKSDPLFNREPMKLNKQRSDMFTSTANVNEPCSTIYELTMKLSVILNITHFSRFSLTKLASSRPRDSSETFLLGKLFGHRASGSFPTK